MASFTIFVRRLYSRLQALAFERGLVMVVGPDVMLEGATHRISLR
jgi:hypothetical protein